MNLIKVKIGDFIEVYNRRCDNPNLTADEVSGINREKEFFEPSRQIGKDTSKYKIVPPNYFACNLMHVGRDKVLPISMNHTHKNKVVSPAYTVFKIVDETLILKEYFFIFLKSDEKDRYFWFNTDASVREGMAWSDFCDVEIIIPSITIQQKVVNIYKALLKNQEIHEEGLEELRLVYKATIEKLIKDYPKQKIKHYIQSIDKRNTKGLFGLESVKGISIQKEFIETKANMKNVSLTSYKVVEPQSFAYVTVTSRNSDKITIAYNNTHEDYIVSSSYVVFNVKNKEELDPEYLFMFFTRSEFDRYARYHSWGSARETFNFDELSEVEIPVPDLKIQQSITKIYHVYIKRKEIAERLKEKINSICPVLIKGSIEEAKEYEKI